MLMLIATKLGWKMNTVPYSHHIWTQWYSLEFTLMFATMKTCEG
jgi:hypothetical protein